MNGLTKEELILNELSDQQIHELATICVIIEKFILKIKNI